MREDNAVLVDACFEYPGTICEWPEDGPGSGKGPYGIFACKHCGRGHNEHGSGDNALAAKLGIPPEHQHSICKVPAYHRMTDIAEYKIPGITAEIGYRARRALMAWRQQELALGNKPGTFETCLGQARYCRPEDTIEWKICGGAPVRRKIPDIERTAVAQVKHKPDTTIVVGSIGADGVDAGIEPYFTVAIPFVGRKHRTEWHPTEDTGPMSTLTRGNFKTIDDAIDWAREKLNGTPYTIKLIKE